MVQVTREAPALGAGERLLDLALPEHAALIDVAVRDRGAGGAPPRSRTAAERATRRRTSSALDRARRHARARALRRRHERWRVRVAGGGPGRRPLCRRATASSAAARDLGRSPSHPVPRLGRTLARARRRRGARHGRDRRRDRRRARDEAARLDARRLGDLVGRARRLGRSSRRTRRRREDLLERDARGRLRRGARHEGARAAAGERPASSSIARAASDLAGLSAERDLAGRMLEALPPATRFDALFFERERRRLFPMSRPATREALSALEAEMVPDRLRNGTDLSSAPCARPARSCAARRAPSRRARCSCSSPTARCPEGARRRGSSTRALGRHARRRADRGRGVHRALRRATIPRPRRRRARCGCARPAAHGAASDCARSRRERARRGACSSRDPRDARARRRRRGRSGSPSPAGRAGPRRSRRTPRLGEGHAKPSC